MASLIPSENYQEINHHYQPDQAGADKSVETAEIIPHKTRNGTCQQGGNALAGGVETNSRCRILVMGGISYPGFYNPVCRGGIKSVDKKEYEDSGNGRIERETAIYYRK
jgi:hypothetical protein